MAKINWDITGIGGQAVIDESGSKRCQLTGTKLMLWNGKSTLANCEVISDIKLYGVAGYNQGGIILRSNASGNNCYMFIRSYATGGIGKNCYIYKIVNSVVTQIAFATTTFEYYTWVKTRVRIDGWQISVDEWINGAWIQLMLVEETTHQFANGYAGLIGTSTNVVGSILFDNIGISERI
jgi:hypothetical protein